MMGVALAITAAVLWGLAYALDQKLLESFSPMALLVLRAFASVVAFAPLLWLSGAKVGTSALNASPRIWWYFIVASVAVIAGNLSILASMKILGATKSSVFEISYPIFVCLFSMWFFGDRPNSWFYIGGALMLSGAMVVILLGHAE